MAWVRLPLGTSGVSVDQVEYNAEAKDNVGHNYVRVPDHKLVTVLAIPGYLSMKPPETDLEDLPHTDAQVDSALQAMASELSKVTQHRDELAVQVDKTQREITRLETMVRDMEKRNADLTTEIQKRTTVETAKPASKVGP